MSEELQNLLNKYECKIIDNIIINKNGNDTKINWQSLYMPYLLYYTHHVLEFLDF